MKRLHEHDQQRVDYALAKIAEAHTLIGEIDLRQYGGDEDVRVYLKRAREEMKGIRALLRAVKALKWERA